MHVFRRSGRQGGRRFGAGMAVIALAALLMTACGANVKQSSDGDGSGDEKVTLTVGYNNFWSVPPFFVGRSLGYYDELPNVTVEWVQFDTPTAALAAMAAGDVDILATPGPNLIQSRASGVKAIGVASLAGESDPAQYAFVAGADSGITEVADLAGKTVGVNNFAGNFDLHLRYLLEEEGLDPEKDLDITVVPISAVVPAVLEGSIDAGAVVGAGSLMAENEEALVTAVTSRDVLPIQGQYSFMILAMSEDLVADRRSSAVEFLTAYARSVDYIAEDPEDSKKRWASDAGVDIVAEMRELNEFPDGGEAQVSGLQFDLGLLEKYGYVTEPVDIDELLDDSLLADARSELGSATN
jgi:ABC-type nitrate/sulfonate/bicarbonate transport system substrate-binding protein